MAETKDRRVFKLPEIPGDLIDAIDGSKGGGRRGRVKQAGDI